MAEMIPFEKSDSSERRAPEEPRTFSNEEVSEIIRMALKTAGQRASDSVDYNEMLAVAKDFGLTPADVTRALETIDETRGEAEIESKAALSVKIHAITFAIIILGLFGINWLSDPTFWWFLYPMVCWGTVLVLHGVLARYAPKLVGMLLGMGSDRLFEIAESASTSIGADSAARFTVPDLYHGMAQSSGLVQVRDDELLIEFETKDSIFGALQSGVREIRVPIADITGVRLDRDFWNTKLIIRGKRLKCFDGFPGHEAGQIRLTLDKHSRAAGERLARELSSRLSPA